MNRFKGMNYFFLIWIKSILKALKDVIAPSANVNLASMVARSTSLLCFCKKWCMKKLAPDPHTVHDTARGNVAKDVHFLPLEHWELQLVHQPLQLISRVSGVQQELEVLVHVKPGQHSRSISRPHTQQTICGSSPTTPPTPRCCTTRTWETSSAVTEGGVKESTGADS